MRHERGDRAIVAIVLGGLMLLPGVLTLSDPAGAQELRNRPRECYAVYGTGILTVREWLDDEPFVVRGSLRMTVAKPADLARYLVEDPSQLDWYTASMWLLAMPGSDAPLPGDIGWAPCSNQWRMYKPGEDYEFDSFCESIIVPDPDEGPDMYEILIREETAWVRYKGEDYKCGRLYTNGPWNASLAEGEVEVAGKFCDCP